MAVSDPRAPRWRMELDSSMLPNQSDSFRPGLRRSYSDESSESATVVDDEEYQTPYNPPPEPTKTSRVGLSYHQSIKSDFAPIRKGPSDRFLAARQRFQTPQNAAPQPVRAVHYAQHAGPLVHLRSSSEISSTTMLDDVSQTNASLLTGATRTSGYSTGTASLQNSLVDLYERSGSGQCTPAHSELSLTSLVDDEVNSAGYKAYPKAAEIRRLMQARRVDQEKRSRTNAVSVSVSDSTEPSSRSVNTLQTSPHAALGLADHAHVAHWRGPAPNSERRFSNTPLERSASTAVQRAKPACADASSLATFAQQLERQSMQPDSVKQSLHNTADGTHNSNGGGYNNSNMLSLLSNVSLGSLRLGAADRPAAHAPAPAPAPAMPLINNARRFPDSSINASPGNEAQRFANANVSDTVSSTARSNNNSVAKNQTENAVGHCANLPDAPAPAPAPAPPHRTSHTNVNGMQGIRVPHFSESCTASIFRAGSMIALPGQYDLSQSNTLTATASKACVPQRARMPLRANPVRPVPQPPVRTSFDLFPQNVPVHEHGKDDNMRYKDELRRQSSIVLNQHGVLQQRSSAEVLMRQRSLVANTPRMAAPNPTPVNPEPLHPRGRSFTASAAEPPGRPQLNHNASSWQPQSSVNKNKNVESKWQQLQFEASLHATLQNRTRQQQVLQHQQPQPQPQPLLVAKSIPIVTHDHTPIETPMASGPRIMPPKVMPRAISPSQSSSTGSTHSGNSIVQQYAPERPGVLAHGPQAVRTQDTHEHASLVAKVEAGPTLTPARSPIRQHGAAKLFEQDDMQVPSVSDEEDEFPAPPLQFTSATSEPTPTADVRNLHIAPSELSVSTPVDTSADKLSPAGAAADFKMPPPLVMLALHTAQREKCEEEIQYEKAALRFVQGIDDPYLKGVLVAEHQLDFKKATDYLDDLFGIVHDTHSKPSIARDSRDSSGRSMSKHNHSQLTEHQISLFNRFGSIRRKQEQLRKTGEPTNHEQSPANDTQPRTPTRLPLNSSYWLSSSSSAQMQRKLRETLEENANEEDGLGLDRGQKREQLVEHIVKKRTALGGCKSVLLKDMNENDTLGKQIRDRVVQKCSAGEVEKFDRYLNELDNIIKLLLKLSGRLARAQNALLSLPDSVPDVERRCLEQKRDTLQRQYEEAKELKDNVDGLAQKTAKILRSKFSENEFDEYRLFTEMKAKLIFELQEIEDSVKMADEQLHALRILQENHDTASRLLNYSRDSPMRDVNRNVNAQSISVYQTPTQPPAALVPDAAMTGSQPTRIVPRITTLFVKQM